MIRWKAGKDAEAKSDFDAAIALSPDDDSALLARAGLAVESDDAKAAVADLDRAAMLVHEAADVRLEIGGLYLRADAYAAAIGQYDLWLKAHPIDVGRAEALDSRCWARAVLNKDRDQAMADCNAALRLVHKASSVLDSRGLVRLRQGDLDGAIADYDAALAADPGIAWSLYGRGVARARKGLVADGQKDIAAAVALDAKLPDKAKRLGLEP